MSKNGGCENKKKEKKDRKSGAKGTITTDDRMERELAGRVIKVRLRRGKGVACWMYGGWIDG